MKLTTGLQTRSLQAQLAVVGAGPAGLAAAVHAAEAGATVCVVDSRGEAGGQIWRAKADAQKVGPSAKWLARALDAGVRFAHNTEIFDARGPTFLLARDHEGTLAIDSERVVLATGARERFLPFVGWDRPGVLGVGALQALCKEGLELRGKRIVLAGSGPLLMAAAADLGAAGAASVVIVEQAQRAKVWNLLPRLLRHTGKLGQAAALGMRLGPGAIRYGSWPRKVWATNGQPPARRASDGGEVPAGLELELAGAAVGEVLSCDLLATAFGLVPQIELGRLLGCESRRESAIEGESERLLVDADQRTTLRDVYAAGEVCGIGGVDNALAQGALAGRLAARSLGYSVKASDIQKHRKASAKAHDFALALGQSYALDRRLLELADTEAILCRCEGVRVDVACGFSDARNAKLQSRCGMGPCQGRVCGPALDFFTQSQTSAQQRAPLIPIRLRDLAQAWSASREVATKPKQH